MNLSTQKTPVYFCIHSAATVSIEIINKFHCSSSSGRHLFGKSHFSLAVILIEVDFCFISPQNFVPELYWFLFVNCNPPFSVLRLGFASCCCSLSLGLWNLIFIMNKETCSPTYWKELLTCCAVTNVSFITMHMILIQKTFSIYQVICSSLVSLWATHFIKCTQLLIIVNRQPNKH